MSSKFIQSGSLTGAVGSQGTLQANVTSQGELKAIMTSEGSLQGNITASETLQATIEPEETLNATIYMPKEKEVLKLANAPEIDEVTLLASAWVSDEEKRHSQVVEIERATNKSQVDLTPDDDQLAVFYKKDIGFVTKNENGKVTVIAIGQKPKNDYSIQVTLTEVNVPDGTTIWGVTVGTTISPESLVEKLDIGETLPTVTDNDEGKILKAQGGKWTVQEDETAEALKNTEIEELLRNFA